MKCDYIRTRKQGEMPFFPNMLNNGNVEVCLKEDVDATIAELREEILNLTAKNTELQSFYDLHGNVDNYIDKLKKKLDEKESWVKMLGEGEATLSLELEKTKQKLENVQASMYADVVDANMDNRRLKRALWIARALRARDIQRWWIAATCAKKTERACSVWNNVEHKCLKKAEEYK